MSFCRIFQNLWSLLKWLLWRQPLPFSISFLVLSAAWSFFGFGLLFFRSRRLYEFQFGHTEPIDCWRQGLFSQACLLVFPREFVYALAVLALFLIGFFSTYNAAAHINSFIAQRWPRRPNRFSGLSPQKPCQSNPPDNPLSEIKRIGIVLAGGGAKGAFQAGAMKAIYRFLAEHNALDKVTVIAGTSIGSWNALFWLSDLMAPDVPSPGQPGQPQGEQAASKTTRSNSNDLWRSKSVHERWWRGISSKSLIAPSWYLPFYRNAFLSSQPWRQGFREIFRQPKVADCLRQNVRLEPDKTKIHFYMTRCNVRTGELECATNHPSPPRVNRMRYEILDPDEPDFLDRIETAVFASMDLPPLFPYFPWEGDLFEDGGVIDNLPISFATHEKENCDLIFVLPLNADFEEEPNERSMIGRLNRIMDMRQGALERAGFKVLYLYNEVAKARQELEKLTGEKSEGKEIDHLAPAERARERKHEAVRVVFAVCPQKSFVEATINTRDLWNSAGAAIAFQEMYKATWRLLSEFDFKNEHSTVRIHLVSRGGMITWDERF
jgi:predicted acylesterase/phospholipase RssA